VLVCSDYTDRERRSPTGYLRSGVDDVRAIARRLSRRTARCAVIAVALLAAAVGANAAQATVVGTQDFSYAGVNQPTAPSGEKPQSKLWFNGGIWWGAIWSTATKAFDIQKFDAVSGWVDTGVVIDSRDKSLADMLWDGTHLYAISAIRQGGSTSDPAVRLYRFSYHASNHSYTLDSGFPVTLFAPLSSADLEMTTLDKDSTGELWATFTYANVPGSCATAASCPAGRSVLYTHSIAGDDLQWSTPAVLPVAHAADVSGDDISTIVHFGSSIGVLFSDQNADGNGVTADYFAVHADGAPEGTWSEETPLAGVLMADDHLNVKAAPDGRVYAAVKTSRNDALAPNPADPMILLLERTTDGVWHQTTFDTVASADTRSQVVLDPSHGVLYQFATFPPSGTYEAGGWIYCKAASMDAPVFAPGRGTPFIQFAAGDHLNNFSSTKQPVSAATQLLGIATDDSTGKQYYAHNTLDLTSSTSCGGVPPPVVVPPDPPPPTTTGPPPVTVPTTPVVVSPSTPAGTSAITGPTTTPTATTTSSPGKVVAPCVVRSPTVQVRSLASRLANLKRTAVVRLRVTSTCALRLTMAARLRGSPGVVVASASVSVKRGQTRIVSIRLTPVGRRLLASHRRARLLLTTRTPAVKGVTPTHIWSTVIVLDA
jgi:hypothetical protein